jgi:uncharacterized protein YndB with AHSA1/START domain
MTTTALIDRIERQIDIDATPERVYALVSRPAWWINEEEVDPDPVLRREGDVTVLEHATWGEFRVQTVTEQPPRHVAFRWIDNVAPQAGTLVEFWIEDRPGGVTLKVAESGFTGLQKDREAIENQVTENTRGWEIELGAAKRYVEARA